MSDYPMKMTWMGVDVDEMTRDEAISALKMCGKMLDESYKGAIASTRFWREMAEHRRLTV